MPDYESRHKARVRLKVKVLAKQPERLSGYLSPKSEAVERKERNSNHGRGASLRID